MARKKRSYRRGFRRGYRRGRGRGGIFGGLKAFDIGQGYINVNQMGYIAAGRALMKGDMTSAGAAVESGMTTRNMIDLSIKNAILGINRKILHAFGGRFVRKWIA